MQQLNLKTTCKNKRFYNNIELDRPNFQNQVILVTHDVYNMHFIILNVCIIICDTVELK